MQIKCIITASFKVLKIAKTKIYIFKTTLQNIDYQKGTYLGGYHFYHFIKKPKLSNFRLETSPTLLHTFISYLQRIIINT